MELLGTFSQDAAALRLPRRQRQLQLARPARHGRESGSGRAPLKPEPRRPVPLTDGPRFHYIGIRYKTCNGKPYEAVLCQQHPV